MLDHVGVEVSDFERSKSFYQQALAPLGLKVVMELVPGVAAGFGAEFPFFWITERGRAAVSGAHVALRAESRETVDAFHAALAAGGTEHRNGGRARRSPACATPNSSTERRKPCTHRRSRRHTIHSNDRRPQHRGRAPHLPG